MYTYPSRFVDSARQCLLSQHPEKIPTKSSKKSDMQSWLSNHGIAYDNSDLKADLMAKITDAKPTKQYETDLIAEKFTHSLKAASGSPRAESQGWRGL